MGNKKLLSNTPRYYVLDVRKRILGIFTSEEAGVFTATSAHSVLASARTGRLLRGLYYVQKVE